MSSGKRECEKPENKIENFAQYIIAKRLSENGYVTLTMLEILLDFENVSSTIKRMRDNGFEIKRRRLAVKTMKEACDKGYLQVDLTNKNLLSGACYVWEEKLTGLKSTMMKAVINA